MADATNSTLIRSVSDDRLHQPRPVKILHLFDHSLPLQTGYTFRSMAILRAQRARG